LKKRKAELMTLYKLKTDVEGIFLRRPNRFIADIEVEGEIIRAHVHDSGRLTELLYKGNKVKVKKADNPERKTAWDLISAKGGEEDVLVNSAYHRYISENLLRNEGLSPFGKVDEVRAEVKYGKSRIDYLLTKGDEKIWVEVKGVSLSIKNEAMFPDAPSERAQKHLLELMELKRNGDRAAILLLILRKSYEFRPKWETDPRFSELFYMAQREGVEIYPVQLAYENDEIVYKGLIPVGKDRYKEEFNLEYNKLNIGEILTNKEIASTFGCSNQGGIRKSKKTNTIVAIAKMTDCLYSHREEKDIFYFMGMGKKGNQELTRQNKALAEGKKEGYEVHLFIMYKEGEYTYKGTVDIDRSIETSRALDSDGKERDVIIFPLRFRNSI
jgi:sugar fermentation stimulation protein A